MLETRSILKNAETDFDALNDFCKIIAEKIPAKKEVPVAELAQHVLQASFDVRKHLKEYADDFPHICRYIQKGGDMCKLAARVSEVVASGTTHKYGKEYEMTSKLYFGACS